MRGGIRGLAVLGCVVLFSPLAPAATGTTATSGGHDAVNFVRARYPVREGAATTDAVVDVVRGTHGRGEASVDVNTYDGERGTPAKAGSDYQSVTRTLHFETCCESAEAKIPILGDGVQEDPETVTLKLENPTAGMVRAFPNEALVTIIDDDGASRVAFELTDYEVFENAGKARVYVVRSGNVANSARVHYETQPGTAAASEDFIGSSGDVVFQQGEYFRWIDIKLVDSEATEQSEKFTVDLSLANGATVGTPSTATVTIHDEQGSVDFTPPYTAFHQPLHGKRYYPRDMKTLIAFMQDNTGGTGMKRVDLAIRMNRDDGSCRWWNGTRFRKGPCRAPSRNGNKRWAETGRGTETRVNYYGDTAVFELGKRLKGSGPRSDIKNYIAYCRGRDVAGNLQDNFDKGQNRNTFDVRGGG